MVTPPKCKVCGAAHFGAAHVWPDTVKAAVSGAIPKAVSRKATVTQAQADAAVSLVRASREVETRRASTATTAGTLTISAATEGDGPQRDRAAYMRDYRAKHPKRKN